ncbi:MAG: hypothetical protein ACR2HF_05570 [Methylococcaceae bacterium]
MKPQTLFRNTFMLLASLGLVACGDYYGTSYRYPYTRTQTQTYQYYVPPANNPASPGYSINRDYEINNNYYVYPGQQNREHDHDHDDDRDRDRDRDRDQDRDRHDADRYQGNPMPYPQRPPSVYSTPNRQQPGYRPVMPQIMPGNRDDHGSDDRGARTCGQQEFDKKMEQMRQRPQSPNGVQRPESSSGERSVQERIQQRREQNQAQSPAMPQASGRVEKPRPIPEHKKHHQNTTSE